MKQKVNKPGFLLIELLVALFLIGSLSIIMSGVYVHVMRQQVQALDLLQALEYLTYYTHNVTIKSSSSFPMNFGKFTVDRSIIADSALKNFVWVYTTVKWADKTTHSKEIELNSLIGVQL